MRVRILGNITIITAYDSCCILNKYIIFQMKFLCTNITVLTSKLVHACVLKIESCFGKQMSQRDF